MQALLNKLEEEFQLTGWTLTRPQHGYQKECYIAQAADLPPRWSQFFKSYGLIPEQGLLDRIFWWTARASLAIALWQFEHGYDGQAFLLDLQAAVNRQPNPHATF